LNRRQRRSLGHRGPIGDLEHVATVPYGEDAGPDTAADVDRQWFENNPGRDVYVRRPIPGEWGPCGNGLPGPPPPGLCVMVEVEQLSPGARMRRPVVLPEGPT